MSIIFSGSICNVGRTQNLRQVIRNDYHDWGDSFCWIQGGCIDAPEMLPARGFAYSADDSDGIWCLPRWQLRGESLTDAEEVHQL